MKPSQTQTTVKETVKIRYSKSILIWAGEFFVINIIYFIIYEEPNLENRFGEQYRQYKKNVNTWVPRIRPYDPQQSDEL